MPVEESLYYTVLGLQLTYRRNAGLPADLESASEDERERYQELLEAASSGDREARYVLTRRGRTPASLESLASV